MAAERGQKALDGLVAPTTSTKSVAEAAQEYLRQIAGCVKRSTYNAYRLMLENFQEACPTCVFLDQVTADTLRVFVAWQRKSHDQNTVYCRFVADWINFQLSLA